MAQTKIVPLSEESTSSQHTGLKKRVRLRTMSKDDFIQEHGSGTLRKNTRIGFDTNLQYKEERAAYEFGWGFKILNHTRITFGIPISEGDCHAVTETGWHTERYLEMNLFEEDIFELKYIQIEESDGTKIEGIGLICRQTSASWVGNNSILYSMIAEYVPRQGWNNAENPF
jgi:hypothetical protein